MKNKGFTLIEVLIASSIFAMVSMIGATIFMNISQSERKTSLTNAIYEDARVVMEMLAREIRAGTIDYEEYYSINVLSADHYGKNRGVYGSRFYDPGYKYIKDTPPEPGDNPADLGTTCFDVDGNSGACKDAYTILFPLSVDKNTGKNFYNDPSKANAFCDGVKGKCDDKPLDELYLISADGREKTILIKQKTSTSGDYALSMIKLEGTDKDTNGVVDTFECKTDYKCSDDPPPKNIQEDLFNIATADFIPISPLRSSISDLKFYISPADDPYKAFAEKDMQYQPYVTIVLTLEPSVKEKANYPGDPPKITIQTTVSAGVKQKITTYPPTKDLNWIQDVTN